ncbi:transglycosylase SLT domain-containing protein (plasmid) [Ralstonia syzygii subsp. celebesensis]|uniref:Putative transglycolsylase from phage n=1 Tax=blood disease bacterium R229 TaxID=741978 RepID=G2ZW06_9RALS|nr:transglycosylase SLT domain-containing protein [Ralstonia syzygii]QQV57861.1 transglycosylase SLT domain-containing protein [Ralstonia syzygii subsp. celebesensis]CCA83289.1 putative transglycolsylase from phage [blood disease bacterium R229]
MKFQPTDDQLSKAQQQDDKLGLPRGTTARQITQESGWNPNAVSSKGAMGYVQVIPKTLSKLEQRLNMKLDPANFDDALTIHGEVMGENLRQFGNVSDALRAYNAGWKPENWNNPETNGYIETILGNTDVTPKGMSAAAAANGGVAGSLREKLAMAERIRPEFQKAAGQDAGTSDAERLAAIGRTGNSSVLDRIEQEGAAQMADTTHQVGMVDAFAQAAIWNTLTGRIADVFRREDSTPGWSMSNEQRDAMRNETPGVWMNDDLRNYVLGAGSDAEWSRRMGWAQQRSTYLNQLGNTSGMQGFGAQTLSFAAGLGDPAMLAGTIGAGWAVSSLRAANALRAAEAAGVAARVPSPLSAIASAAAENVAADVAMRKLDNQEIEWSGVAQQAIAGAALGGFGHLIHTKMMGPSDAHVIAGAEGNLQTTVDNAVSRVSDPVRDNNGGTIGSGLNEVAAHDPTAHLQEQPRLVSVREDGTLVDPNVGKVGYPDLAANAGRDILTEQQHLHAVPEYGAMARERGKVGDLRRAAVNDASQENVAALFKNDRSETTAVRAEYIHEQGVAKNATEPMASTQGIRAELARIADSQDSLAASLAVRLRDSIHDDVGFTRTEANSNGGTYSLSSHEVRVGSKADDFVVLHEAAHAVTAYKLEYGLSNPNSVHGKIVKELEALRQEAAEAFSKSDRMAQHYLGNVHEFVAGLFSGKSEFINLLAGMKKEGQSILGRLFNGVRRLLGLDVAESSALARAMNLTDRLLDEPLSTTVMRSDGRHFSVLQSPNTLRDEGKASPLVQAFGQHIADHQEHKTDVSRRAEAWYGKANILWDTPGLGKLRRALDSVGLRLGMSDSKGVRLWSSILGESATGINRQHANSAAIDKIRLTHLYKQGFIELYNHVVPDLLASKDKLKWMAGGGMDAEKAIGRKVAELREAKRKARLAGRDTGKYEDTPYGKLAGALDGFWRNITEDSLQAGEALGTAIHNGMGWQGHMPYRWDWSGILDAYHNDVPRFNEFKGLIREQYVSKVLDPMLAKLRDVGPQTPEAFDALHTEVMQKVGNLTDRYVDMVMRSPEERIQHTDNHLQAIAGDLLAEDWKNAKVTPEMIGEFKKRLTEIRDDRTRTEFDLLAQSANGVSLMDFLDTDLGRMVNGNASKFAGNIALARRGLKSVEHIDALKEALRRDGASPKEIDDIDFLIRSHQDRLNNGESAVASMLQMGAHMSMMGKIGFNALADAAGVVSAVGVRGLFKTLGTGFSKLDTPLIKQLAEQAGSLLGADYRLHMQQTSEGHLRPEGLLAEGSTFRRMMDKGVNAVNHLSGLNLVGKMIHRGMLPAITEEIWQHLATGKSVMGDRRFADLGFQPTDIERIQAQMQKYDAGRAKGDAINWDKWDDQHAADAFIGVLHRATFQSMQRAMIGEVPRWAAEGMLGKIVSQFRRSGLLASEKQMMRNLFINDSNTYTAFTFATAWGAMLYQAKAYTNTIGMSEQQRDKYLKDNLSGYKLATGVAVMVNMAGLLPDSMDAGSLMFGGQTHGNSGPVAALGYLQNLGRGMSAVGNVAYGAATGHKQGSVDPVDYMREVKNGTRWVPGANTIFGTALSNELVNNR